MTSALSMRYQLSRLRRHHGLAEPEPVTIPLSQPTPRPQVLSGRASTLDVDLQRQCFRPWAFGAVHRHDPPPLFFKHDQERGEVGTIQSLSYDDQGALRVVAHVHDQLARRANAWSVGAVVHDFEIMGATSPDFFSLIRSATLTEISLSDIPANPNALVTHRREASSQAEVYQTAQRAIAIIQRKITILAGATA